MFLLDLGRKVLSLHILYALCAYFSSTFLLPMLLNFPGSYLAEADNIFNEYFIKHGWWWTMSVIFPLTLLTSYVNCCGHWSLVLKHVSRLGVATSFWYIWTSIFEQIVNNVGKCIHLGVTNDTKLDCHAKGYYWQGIDISVNTFTLIYSSIVLITETKVLFGWEVIDKLIKEEDRNIERYLDVRKDRPMHKLTYDDFKRLKVSYSTLSPFIQVLFQASTCLTLLWTSLLISTLVYFNTVVGKVFGGEIALITWFFTYKWLYPLPSSIFIMPGDGLFIYQNIKTLI